MIQVTQPFLPPEDEYIQYLNGIWNRNVLTNNGPLVNELEAELKKYLGLDNLLYLSNGTVAIQIAIKALGLKGKIITTPFSFVATTSSIVWENCEPVFADIDPETLNIDPDKIEACIDENVSGILATHCFGNPCDIDAIQKIADKHKLKVIYDAAHCFGSLYKNKSVFAFGDVTTTSFHATKLFHTIEGGAVFSQDNKILDSMSLMRNFGHNGPEKFSGVGINGKNSEFHAAMGLVNLKYVNEILAKRKKINLMYKNYLDCTSLILPVSRKESDPNFSYFPVIFSSEKVALSVKSELEKNKIFPRRYFYPSLSSLNYIRKQPTTISDRIASSILCLPVFHSMDESTIELICKIVNSKSK